MMNSTKIKNKMKRLDSLQRIDIYDLDPRIKKEFQHEFRHRGIKSSELFAEMWNLYINDKSSFLKQKELINKKILILEKNQEKFVSRYKDKINDVLFKKYISYFDDLLLELKKLISKK